MNNPERTNQFSLAPPEATEGAGIEVCWNCDCYSFKVYGGDWSSGKCFRDYAEMKKVWYVYGDMTCPGWKPDRTVGTDDDP